MPDVDDLKEGKKYQTDTPQKAEGFFLKGSNSLDWGMKNRLSRIFNPKSGRTVMLAVDHGYFQGPTTGLERHLIASDVHEDMLADRREPLAPLAAHRLAGQGRIESVARERLDDLIQFAAGHLEVLEIQPKIAKITLVVAWCILAIAHGLYGQVLLIDLQPSRQLYQHVVAML